MSRPSDRPTPSATVEVSPRDGKGLRRLAAMALLIGLALMALFAWRAWRQHDYERRLADGQVQVETLRGWMTLPYIERAHGLPQSELRAALGLPAEGGDDRSLRDWFERQGIDPLQGRQKVEALILRRSPSTVPPPP